MLWIRRQPLAAYASFSISSCEVGCTGSVAACCVFATNGSPLDAARQPPRAARKMTALACARYRVARRPDHCTRELTDDLLMAFATPPERVVSKILDDSYAVGAIVEAEHPTESSPW